MNCYKINKYCSQVFSFLLLMMIICLAVVESIPGRRPRFIAIPLEDVQLVEVEDLPNLKAAAASANTARIPRHALPETQNDPDAARFERQAHNDHHHHEYVDFGAHTGHHGSFGWYADFPVKDPGH